AVLVGGMAAVAGELRDGAALRWALGDSGTAVLRSVLGPEYGSLLPLLLSALVLVALSRLRRRR
ncbi:MAG: hypothetical protein ACLFRX_10335, partial [Gemmatimonadota bacterium]